MRRLIPEDTITPLFDRVQELYEEFSVSTLIVVGGSSEYLGVAKEVIARKRFKDGRLSPSDLSAALGSLIEEEGLGIPEPWERQRKAAGSCSLCFRTVL